MANNEEIRQPQTVSNALANYLDMTAPRRNGQKRRPRHRNDHEQSKRPPVDNRGLSLDEGNDFA
jgi:hypothetical protein